MIEMELAATESFESVMTHHGAKLCVQLRVVEGERGKRAPVRCERQPSIGNKAREIEQVLDGVHGETAPDGSVNAAMVKRVDVHLAEPGHGEDRHGKQSWRDGLRGYTAAR